MSSYIADSGNAMCIAKLCYAEIDDNLNNLLPSPNSDWSDSERRCIKVVLGNEVSNIARFLAHHDINDSVKGESAMREVYNYDKKAVDIITGNNCLVLSELKYMIKVGGVGPFGGPGSFKKRVSDKFLEMNHVLDKDSEQVSPLRVIVTNEEQYPYFVAQIHGLIDSQDKPGEFSSDNNEYDYALCTSRSLGRVVYSNSSSVDDDDVFYFKI